MGARIRSKREQDIAMISLSSDDEDDALSCSPRNGVGFPEDDYQKKSGARRPERCTQKGDRAHSKGGPVPGCHPEFGTGIIGRESAWEYWHRYDAAVQKRAIDQLESSVGRHSGDKKDVTGQGATKIGPVMAT